MVVSVAFVNLAWMGTKFNSIPYFVFKFGMTNSIGELDQSKQAAAQFAIYAPSLLFALLCAIVVEYKGFRLQVCMAGSLLSIFGQIIYLNSQSCFV